MSDPAAAISAIASSAQPMVRVPNPAGGEGGLSLSEAARGTLSSLGQLQADFAREAQRATQMKPEAVEAQAGPSGSPDLMKAAHTMADQIEASTQVQAQLVKFVAASSISSSFGRNLNMFLRGQ
jgi:hypothetical protein